MRLAALVRAGGRLVIDEFDVARFDERAARWWIAQRAAMGERSEHEPAAMVEHYRGHLHALSRVMQQLAGGFAVGMLPRGLWSGLGAMAGSIGAILVRSVLTPMLAGAVVARDHDTSADRPPAA